MLIGPGSETALLRSEIVAAVERVLDSGQYILGTEVSAFEAELAAAIDAPFAIGVGSGTDALTLALAAVGVGAGDEVVTVAHTAVATVSAITRLAATPVFADIDSSTQLIDPASVEQALTAATRAIVPVHLYGGVADLDALVRLGREHGIAVVEDCAQAFGARRDGSHVGLAGDAAAFSFYPTKNLGAIGDGGAVVTRHGEIAERVRLLREYGWRDRYVSELDGYNSRLDELQAAVLRVKLSHFDELFAARLNVAQAYQNGIVSPVVELPVIRVSSVHAFHLYVVRTRLRDKLRTHLDAAGVPTLVHYPVPIHEQPAYRYLATRPLPETEAAAREVLSLPIGSGMEPGHVHQVIEAVNAFVTEAPAS